MGFYDKIYPWQTRLARLTLSTDDTARLEINIIIVDSVELDVGVVMNHDTIVMYDALSYTWGNEPASVECVCDGATILLRDNLAAALKYLRRPRDAWYVWVDFLCIDQQDDIEKSFQIPRMRSVYSKTSLVVIWLGESPALESLPRLCNGGCRPATNLLLPYYMYLLSRMLQTHIGVFIVRADLGSPRGIRRHEIEHLFSLPLGVVGKARKSVTKATIVATWRHTGNWPISHTKALNHPEIKPDREERGVAQPSAEAEDDDAEEPISRDYVMSLAEDGNALVIHRARRVVSELEELRARISFLEEENAALKEREELRSKINKRKSIPNPNEKFMTIHDILSKGGSLEDLKEQNRPQKKPRMAAKAEVVEVEDDDEEEQESGIEDEIPDEIQK